MKQFLTIACCAALAILLLATGCSKSSKNPANPGPDANQLAQEGWTSFASHDYTAALAKFRSAIALDSTNRDARVGAGWCYIRLDYADSARTHLNYVLSIHPTDADALCGNVAATVMQNDFEHTLQYASSFLTSAGDTYVFTRDTTVTSRDVRILYALASFHRGDYPTALAQVTFLNPSVDLDPAAPTYPEELLAAIEALIG